MEVKIDTYKPARGSAVRGYSIYDDNKRLLESGSGFVTQAYLDQAIAMRVRALKGLRPLRPSFKEASSHSMAIVEKWNNEIYGKVSK
jgi:hypothetical protein